MVICFCGDFTVLKVWAYFEGILLEKWCAFFFWVEVTPARMLSCVTELPGNYQVPAAQKVDPNKNEARCWFPKWFLKKNVLFFAPKLGGKDLNQI